MNIRYLLLPLCFLMVFSIARAQVSTAPPKHNFSIGPIGGYDYKFKRASYGAGLIYEYRPFQQVGFTAGFNYERTRKNLSPSDYGELLLHDVYSLSIGARYYVGDLYLGGALGVGHENADVKLEDGSERNAMNAYSLYKSLGAGYLIPLRNRDAIEVEAGVFGTSTSMKLGGAVRYKMRR